MNNPVIVSHGPLSFQCTELLGNHKGVCNDDKVGGYQDYQPFSSKRENGINIFTLRRRLTTRK